MSSLDHFCLRGLAATVILMLAMAASEYYPTGTRPVVLIPAAKADPCGDDWVCVLASEAKAEARQPKGRGHGYSEAERNEMTQLIARLP